MEKNLYRLLVHIEDAPQDGNDIGGWTRRRPEEGDDGDDNKLDNKRDEIGLSQKQLVAVMQDQTQQTY